MQDQRATVHVVGPDDASREEVADLTDDLRGVLGDAGFAVERVREDVPDGAKPVEVIAVGALLVAVAPAVVEGLFATLNAWLARRRGVRRIEFEVGGRSYAVTGRSDDELRTAIRMVTDELDGGPETAEHRG